MRCIGVFNFYAVKALETTAQLDTAQLDTGPLARHNSETANEHAHSA